MKRRLEILIYRYELTNNYYFLIDLYVLISPLISDLYESMVNAHLNSYNRFNTFNDINDILNLIGLSNNLYRAIVEELYYTHNINIIKDKEYLINNERKFSN